MPFHAHGVVGGGGEWMEVRIMSQRQLYIVGILSYWYPILSSPAASAYKRLCPCDSSPHRHLGQRYEALLQLAYALSFTILSIISPRLDNPQQSQSRSERSTRQVTKQLTTENSCARQKARSTSSADHRIRAPHN
eukprot:scaffold23257_cov109-Skeletonema_dohrnii-CCMP3373.AAC.2